MRGVPGVCECGGGKAVTKNKKQVIGLVLSIIAFTGGVILNHKSCVQFPGWVIGIAGFNVGVNLTMLLDEWKGEKRK